MSGCEDIRRLAELSVIMGPLVSAVQVADASTARETDPSVPSKEDIPTFDEWKKQVLEVEMEKSKAIHY